MHMLKGHRDIPVTLCMCLKGLVGPMPTVSEAIVMMLGSLSSMAHLPQQMTQPYWKESITKLVPLWKFHCITLG